MWNFIGGIVLLYFMVVFILTIHNTWEVKSFTKWQKALMWFIIIDSCVLTPVFLFYFKISTWTLAFVYWMFTEYISFMHKYVQKKMH